MGIREDNKLYKTSSHLTILHFYINVASLSYVVHKLGESVALLGAISRTGRYYKIVS